MHDLAVVGISRTVLRVAHGLLELAGAQSTGRATTAPGRFRPTTHQPASLLRQPAPAMFVLTKAMRRRDRAFIG